MSRFVQLVMGPAGVGKSSYCQTMQEHCRTSKRTLHVANLDPAAEHFEYDPAFDIRDFVNLEEIMDELGYGPNGGLVYAMEYLLENSEWLKDQLDEYVDDEYIILDCPGQVELYSHLPIMRNLARQIESWGFRVMKLPHVNVITKCDLVDKEKVTEVLESEGASFISLMDKHSPQKLRQLTEAISGVVDGYMMVSFAMLDPQDEDSIEDVLFKTDQAVQYAWFVSGEDLEPKEPRDLDAEAEQDEDNFDQL